MYFKQISKSQCTVIQAIIVLVNELLYFKILSLTVQFNDLINQKKYYHEYPQRGKILIEKYKPTRLAPEERNNEIPIYFLYRK